MQIKDLTIEEFRQLVKACIRETVEEIIDEKRENTDLNTIKLDQPTDIAPNTEIKSEITDESPRDSSKTPAKFNSSLQKLVTEAVTPFIEIFLDKDLPNELWKSIPIVNSIYKGISIASSVRDVLFYKKVCKFIYAFGDITEQEREDLINLSKSNPSYIFQLIDRLDDEEKAEMAGKSFRAHANKKISLQEFKRLNHGISNLLVDNLEELQLFYSSKEYKINEDSLQNLSECGFIKTSSSDGAMLGAGASRVGKLFVTYILESEIHEWHLSSEK